MNTQLPLKPIVSLKLYSLVIGTSIDNYLVRFYSTYSSKIVLVVSFSILHMYSQWRCNSLWVPASSTIFLHLHDLAMFHFVGLFIVLKTHLFICLHLDLFCCGVHSSITSAFGSFPLNLQQEMINTASM